MIIIYSAWFVQFEGESVELSYQELEAGQTFPPREFEVTREAIRHYREATGEDPNGGALLPLRWCGPPGASGTPGLGTPPVDEVAPSTFAHLFAVPRVVVPDAVLPPGGIHARQEYEFHRPLRAGERVQTTMRVAEKYEKRGRCYLVYEFEVRDEGGALCMVSRMTAIAPR
jgi:hypothetical protein